MFSSLMQRNKTTLKHLSCSSLYQLRLNKGFYGYRRPLSFTRPRALWFNLSIYFLFFTEKWTEREVIYVSFVGKLFLRMLKALILPLIIPSLVAAVGSLDMSLSGKVASSTTRLALRQTRESAQGIGSQTWVPWNSLRVPLMHVLHVCLNRNCSQGWKKVW